MTEDQSDNAPHRTGVSFGKKNFHLNKMWTDYHQVQPSSVFLHKVLLEHSQELFTSIHGTKDCRCDKHHLAHQGRNISYITLHTQTSQLLVLNRPARIPMICVLKMENKSIFIFSNLRLGLLSLTFIKSFNYEPRQTCTVQGRTLKALSPPQITHTDVAGFSNCHRHSWQL